MRSVLRAVARTAASLGVVVGSLVLSAGPAQACSCAGGDPRDRLEEAAGAFVGEMLGRDGDDVIFAVTTPIKGELGSEIRISSPAGDIGGACGLETTPGRRVGLLLYEGEDGALAANLCTTIDPDELLRVAQPLPEPDGAGPVRFLVGGSFGPARLVALDARGRTLAYGAGAGYVLQVAVCPQGRFAVELAIDGTAEMKEDEVTLAVRDLATFEVVREIPLPSEHANAGALSCRDPGATTSLVGARAGLVAVEGDVVTTLYVGSFVDADLSHPVAYGVDHRELIAVDPATREVRTIGTVPRQFAGVSVGPGGTRVAGTLGTYPTEDPELVVVADLPPDPGPLEFRTAELEGWNEGGDAVWVDEERVVYLPGGGDHDVAHVYDAASMQEVGRFAGWYSSEGLVVDGVAFGVGWGTMFRAELPRGPAERIARLESPETFAFAGVEGNVHVDPPAAPDAGDGAGVRVAAATEPGSGMDATRTVVAGLVAGAAALAFFVRRRTRARG